MNRDNRPTTNGPHADPAGLLVAPDESVATVSMADIIGLVKRRWLPGLAVLVLVMVLVMAYTARAPRVYEATALVMVEDPNSSPMSALQGLAVGGLLGLGTSSSLGTQAEIIRSSVVMDFAWEAIGPAVQETVDEEADVIPLRDTQLIQIKTQGHTREAAVVWAEAIVDRYLEHSLAQNRSEVSAVSTYTAERLAEVEEQLTATRQELRDFKQANLTLDPKAEASTLVAQLGQIESELRAARAQRAAQQAELRSRQQPSEGLGGRTYEASDLVAAPAVISLRQQLATLEQERLTLLLEFTPTSPEAEQINQRIEQVHQQLHEATHAAVARELAPFQARIWALDAQISALEAASARATGELAGLPEDEYQLADLELRLGTERRLYEMLTGQAQQLALTEQGKLAHSELVAPAVASEDPISPIPMVNLALGVFFGMVLAMALGVVLEQVDDRVHTEEKVRAAFGAAVIARVPPARRREDLVVSAEAAWSPILEDFRAVRSAILLSPDSPRSLLVAGWGPDEGRTMVAANVGAALALSGKRTIVVDSDMRAPSLHEWFGVPNTVGLADVLAGRAQLGQAVQETGIPNLVVLTSGPAPSESVELLSSDAGTALMADVADTYEFAVLDSAPIDQFSDAMVLASRADAALQVVAMDQARPAGLTASAHVLTSAGAKAMGIVLNRTAPR